jgi:hypothetical protein
MIRPLRSSPFLFAALLIASGASHAAASQSGSAPGLNPYRIPFKSGAYRCELGRSVHVRQVSPDQRTAVLQWQRHDYTLHAVRAQSGALRYEDAESGLVWIVIHGKSMLLDSKAGQRLADACRA